MECEKCKGRGYIEYEHGLIMVECEDCKGTGKVEDVLTSDPSGATYTGLYFQLTGKRTNEYSDGELWMMTKEAALEKVEFPWTIEMPCGKTHCFDTHLSILTLPIEDIPCYCGNPNHYLVRFIDARDDSINEGTGRTDTITGSGDTGKPRSAQKSKAVPKPSKRSKRILPKT